jgi:DnaJ-class molecular chaperone
MVHLELCNLCGGHGFVAFYHAEGNALEAFRDLRSCPACQGAGALEPWRQAATGLHGWGREEDADLQAQIRQREEPR